MKKLIKGLVLALIVSLSLIGCGNFGKFEIQSTTTKSYDYHIVAVSPFTDFADNTVVQNTTDASITAASWSVIINTGGAGTIDLKLLAYGADCAGIGTTVTIPVAANTTIGNTALSAGDITAINVILPANSQYRICMVTTPADAASPMNLTLRFRITISGTMK